MLFPIPFFAAHAIDWFPTSDAARQLRQSNETRASTSIPPKSQSTSPVLARSQWAAAERSRNYPKHVWSPAGGWYAQPANWKANTAVFGVVIFGITALVWKLSAEREFRHKMPEPGRFYPSRNWSKQIIEHERAQEKAALEKPQES
ncbi:hypothetical protein L209DRAFT_132804 [Thermothelomyces heterothallicus CBS 203.75]